MKNSILLLLLFVVGISSCKKFDKKTQFDITIENEIEIPSIVGVNLPFNLPTTSINTEINKQLEIRNKKKKKIEKIYLTDLELIVLSPAGKNLNFLKGVKVYISAEGLDEILVAEAENLPNTNSQHLKIPTHSEIDLTEYVKKDTVNLRVEVTTDETIFQKVKLNVKSTFWIDAKVLGI